MGAMNLHHLDINEVYYFIRIMQAGSISSASRLLNIPKSKLSRKLSSLEKKMAVNLVKRKTRQLELTSEGQKLFDRTESHFDFIVTELDNLVSPHSMLSGEFRIAAPVAMASDSFVAMIGEFRRRNPALRVHLDLLPKGPNLAQDDYDVAFAGGTDMPPQVVAVKLMEIDIQLYASAQFAQERGLPQELDELPRFACVSMHEVSELLPLTSYSSGEVRKVPIHPVMLSNQPQVVRGAVLQGQGIGFLPAMFFKKELDSGQVLRVLPEWHYPGVGLYLTYLKQKVRNPKVKAFVNFIKADFKNYEGIC
ncbi:LysR family transcriptional regulator [Bdellovibrio sp.]|uniref:LysR family transcriptional regulator n=1 Tax=Bdellovibrio TaxID=958 RepID=UPI003221E2EE